MPRTKDRLHCPKCGSTRFTIPANPAGDEGTVVCDQCGEILGDWAVLKRVRVPLPGRAPNG